MLFEEYETAADKDIISHVALHC